MILSINEHIAAMLAASTQVTASVGTRCYPIASVKDETFPIIVYTRNSVNPVYDKSGKEIADTSASVYVVSDSYSESLELAEKVVKAIDKKTASYTGYSVVDARLTGASEDYSNGAYLQQLTFNFTIKES